MAVYAALMRGKCAATRLPSGAAPNAVAADCDVARVWLSADLHAPTERQQSSMSRYDPNECLSVLASWSTWSTALTREQSDTVANQHTHTPTEHDGLSTKSIIYVRNLSEKTVNREPVSEGLPDTVRYAVAELGATARRVAAVTAG